MIPEFPHFKNLQLSDKDEIEKISSKFPPYAAFNFTNLWAWDVREDRKVSKLDGNLVVLFTDYITGEPYLSFLGTNNCEDTVSQLLDFARRSKISQKICFVTEESVQQLQSSNLSILEDRDNTDYVFSAKKLAQLSGVELRDQRHLATRFAREYPGAIFSLEDLGDPSVQRDIYTVLRKWEDIKRNQKKTFDLRFEELALKRLLETVDSHALTLSCIRLNDLMIGFSIDEILPGQGAIAHFIKADNSYVGIYEFLNRELAKYLVSHDVIIWNWQQDLNIENLRKTKLGYRPVAFLKRYTVSSNPHYQERAGEL